MTLARRAAEDDIDRPNGFFDRGLRLGERTVQISAE
jgi:hypothetical protein